MHSGTKSLLLSLVAIIILIGGALYATNVVPQKKTTGEETKNNVSIVDGKQVVEILAHGGYTPEKSIAKAGIPTIISFVTQATFDCSSSVRIPSMDISVRLPANGSTNVDIGVPKEGVLHGVCAMGMYPFDIVFEK